MKLADLGSRVLAWRALQKAAGAAVIVVVMQGLGPEGNGRYSLSVTVVTVLAALLSGGVGLASVPRLNDAAHRARDILRAQAFWLGLATALLLVVAAVVRLGDGWSWFRDSLGWTDPLLLAALVAVVAMIAHETANYDLLAGGRVVLGTRTASLRATALLLAMAGLLLALSGGIGAAFAAFAVSHGLAAGVLVAIAWRHVRRAPDRGRAAPNVAAPVLARRLVRHGWLGQLSALVYLLLLRLDQFLIENALGVAAVGLYAAAAWVAELLWLVPEALNPLVVHTASRAGGDDRDAITARAVRLGLAVTALAAVPLAVVAGPLLGVLRDGAFAAAVDPLLVLLPGVVAFAPGVILAGDFIGRGRPHWNTQASVLTVLVNVALCLLWIPRAGIVGAAWASTVAYAAGSALMLLRFRRLTGIAWSALLLPRPGDLRR